MKKNTTKPATQGDFESLVTSIIQIHQQAHEFATRAVNIGLPYGTGLSATAL